jgi:sensor domain CHASE-containing protein
MLWKSAKSSLNAKVMRLLAVVIAILLAGNGLVFAFVIWPTFTDLENGAAQQNLQRVQEALSKERDDLARVAHDWSAWDPTYEYVVKPNEDYDRQSFTYDVMKDLDLDFIGIYDTNGHRVRSQAFDLETGKETTVTQFSENLPLDHPLLSHGKPDGVAGILLTEHGPMLLASFPILQSTREGPVRGSFFMGRLLDAGMIEGLEHQTHVMFNLFRTDQGTLPTTAASAIGRLRQGETIVFNGEPSEILASYQNVPTLLGGEPLLLRAETPRRISAIGLTTLTAAGLSTLVTSLLVMTVIWFTLTRLIVTPLNRLTNHVLAVGKTGDLTRRIALDRNDEIGLLSKQFDEAAAQLDNARRRLLEQSYQSGMAEIAAGVIHNIRNALSPTVVTVAHLSEKAAKPPAAHLDAALADLKSKDTPTERREMLLEYVEAAIRELEDRRRATHRRRSKQTHRTNPTGPYRAQHGGPAARARERGRRCPRCGAPDSGAGLDRHRYPHRAGNRSHAGHPRQPDRGHANPGQPAGQCRGSDPRDRPGQRLHRHRCLARSGQRTQLRSSDGERQRRRHRPEPAPQSLRARLQHEENQDRRHRTALVGQQRRCHGWAHVCRQRRRRAGCQVPHHFANRGQGRGDCGLVP